jgi:competence protein ComEA
VEKDPAAAQAAHTDTLGPPRPQPDVSPLAQLREFIDEVPRVRALGTVLAVSVVLVVAGIWYLDRAPPAPPVEEHLPLATVAPAPTPSAIAELAIHAAGAVTNPGVYTVEAGARVADVVVAAGGLSPAADLDRLNLAAPVQDGQRVFVPRQGETVPEAADQTAPQGPGDTSSSVNVNSATPEQLESLPGVGPATAAAIIERREKVGGFDTVEALLDVPGIGPAKLEGMRQHVRVS